MNSVWTEAEQKQFSKALETYGRAPTEDIWLTISESIGTKTAREVYCFAFDYLLQLQACSQAFIKETRLHNIEFSHWTKCFQLILILTISF